jgi:rhodanese-related sulfurtransferase
MFFAACNIALATEMDWSEVTIIDVRSRAEWNDSRLENSIWIPWNQIEQGIARHQLHPSQPLAFYCERGVRADRAMRRLSRLGYYNTINLINLEVASKATGFKILK